MLKPYKTLILLYFRGHLSAPRLRQQDASARCRGRARTTRMNQFYSAAVQINQRDLEDESRIALGQTFMAKANVSHSV